jgi:hypothetical protein
LSPHLSQLHKASGAQVWRGVVVVVAAIGKFWFWLGLSFGYGLEFLLGRWLFLLGALALERGMLPRLAISPKVFIQNYSLSMLRCSGVASAYGWVKILLYYPWLNEHTYYL